MDNSTKIDDMEKGIRSAQPEKVKRATFTANKIKITKSTDECRKPRKSGTPNVEAQPTKPEWYRFWIIVSFAIIWIIDAIQRMSKSGDLGALWYVIFLPRYFKHEIFMASMFANLAIWIKSGRKITAFVALFKGIASMVMLVYAIVSVFYHPHWSKIEEAEEEEMLNKSIKNYYGNLLFKYFTQLILLAYINFYGLPRLYKSG